MCERLTICRLKQVNLGHLETFTHFPAPFQGKSSTAAALIVLPTPDCGGTQRLPRITSRGCCPGSSVPSAPRPSALPGSVGSLAAPRARQHRVPGCHTHRGGRSRQPRGYSPCCQSLGLGGMLTAELDHLQRVGLTGS